MSSFLMHFVNTQYAQVTDPRTWVLILVLFCANLLTLKFSDRPIRDFTIVQMLGLIPSWGIWLSNW